MTAFAYAISLIVYQIGLALTGSMNIVGLIFAVVALALIIYMLVRPYKESKSLVSEVKVK